jgi:hypothetical protein
LFQCRIALGFLLFQVRKIFSAKVGPHAKLKLQVSLINQRHKSLHSYDKKGVCELCDALSKSSGNNLLYFPFFLGEFGLEFCLYPTFG